MTTPDWILQQRRSELMESLYQVSGRSNGLMTGLWHGAALELAARMRDTNALHWSSDVDSPEAASNGRPSGVFFLL